MRWDRKQLRRLTTLGILCAACLILTSGCAVLRLADFAAPAIRFDRANNKPLPAREDPAVAGAIDAWTSLSDEERQRYPTPYHLYVDTPAPGTFEGDDVVALAFSGGGTRGTVFCAACLKEIEKLGPILVDTPSGEKSVSPLTEVDYVSGVSTGAIPAAAFALNQGECCPEKLALSQWPECFNADVTGYSLKRLFIRPDRILRDMAFDMNTRPTGAGGIAGVFFEGNPYRIASGLTLRDLPPTPILLMASTVVDDPGAPFIQTRLPYRYTLDTYPDLPWGVGVQSFESFRSDPMPYGLGEACYNSSAFPGYMRAGLMKMQDDQEWLTEALDEPERKRMARARHQEGYRNTYNVKDGGLVDNRGIEPVNRLFEHLAETGAAPTPLLICFDAGYRELRTPKPGRKLVKNGWLAEIYDSSGASWRTGQQAYERLHQSHTEAGLYTLARFRYIAWLPYLPDKNPNPEEGQPEEMQEAPRPSLRATAGERGNLLTPSETHESGCCDKSAPPDTSPDPLDPISPETRHLVNLCEQEPLISDPNHLLEVTRGVGTMLGKLTETEMAAIRVAARFAVWHEKDALLRWASDRHNGARARFAEE